MSLRALAPSIFTCSNGIFGLCAILAAATMHVELAVLFLALALICDGLDGTVARALGVSSEFGVQYDTVNDCVTFGAAPAVLGYFALSPVVGAWAILPAALYAGCALFRLARFNTRKIDPNPGAPKKSTYDGLPSTGGTMVVMAMVVGAPALGLGTSVAAGLIAGGLVLAGCLMVSTVQYGVLKHVIKAPRIVHLLVTLPVVLSAFWSWQIALLALAVIYALHGPALSVWQKLRHA